MCIKRVCGALCNIHICMCFGKVKMLPEAGCMIWVEEPQNLMTLLYNPPCVIDTIYLCIWYRVFKKKGGVIEVVCWIRLDQECDYLKSVEFLD
jgi:hypothetical protein